MEYDDSKSMTPLVAIPAASHAAPVTGQTIDTLGHEALTFIFATGAVGAGDADFVVQHAPDDGSGSPGAFVAVGADDLIGDLPTFGTTDDNATARVGYRGKERFVRVNSLETNAWTTHFHSVVAVLSQAKHVPQP